MQLTSLSLALTRAGFRSFSPASLFAAGDQGVWYDPSDYSTLFQDSAGTTPVTALEQPVGLMLDKSRGLVLGPELVVNGTFDANINGWTVGNTGESALSWEFGKIRITRVNAGSTFPNARTTMTGLVVGRTYKIVSQTNNPFGIEAYHSITSIVTSLVRTTLAARTIECIFTATATSHSLDVGIWAASGSVGQYVEFDNISVRELPGNHATQPTATSRPVVSARVNLLTKTEQFDDAVWTKSNATVTANAVTAPDGTLTADAIVENTSNAIHRVQTSISNVSGGRLRYSVRFKALSEGRNIELGLVVSPNFVTTVFSSETGAVLSTGDSLGSKFSEKENSVSGPDLYGFYTASISVDITASASLFIFAGIVNGTVNTYTGDGISGIYIWGADLRVANDGVNLPPYQRVNTATDYDSTGFPIYLRSDGVDDGMVTNSIDFTATDKMTVVAGVRKLSDADVGIFLEHGVGGTNIDATTFINAPRNAGVGNYASDLRSSGTTGTIRIAPFNAPDTAVLAVIQNRAATTVVGQIVMRRNGVTPSQDVFNAGVVVGNFGNYPLYLFRRGDTTLPFNGRFYGLTIVNKLLSTTELAQLETYTNGKTKAFA